MPRPGSPPLSGNPVVGQTMGRYRVTERIGEGGMGVVYRATDERLGREVALKVLSPRLSLDKRAHRRMLQEARAAAALDHPHVASVYDVGEADDGRFYIAMAFYPGETLEERLERGTLDPEDAIALGVQIARGLGAAHRAGIVHRDVKPANVMVMADGGPGGGPCARVLDFGIASVPDGALTQTGESMGTALYMSPEHLRGEAVDARSDVWALGVLLYEALVGHRPFQGAYAAAVGYAVLHEEPAPLADLGAAPDGLSDVVSRCLAKDPAARYADGDALADALDRLRQSGTPFDPAHLGTEAEAQATATQAPPRSAILRWGVIALATTVAAAVLALAWTMWRPADVVAAPQRLAVLAFRAIGPDAEQLSAGLVETVTSKLSQLGPLQGRVHVVPASEVGGETTPSQAQEQFDASLVVEGTVQAENGRVRVTVTLVDVGGSSPSQLGSREIDDESGSAFAIQDAAVLEVADLLRQEGGLHVEVGDGDRQALAAGGTSDPEANELYLRGRGVLRDQQGVDDLDQARSLFREALEIDPTFVLAHAGLAEAQWQTYNRTSTVAWADSAVATAQRALDLDDDLAEVHLALGIIYEGRGEYGQALATIDRALALDPANAEAMRRLARVYGALGRDADAQVAFRQAIALAPDYWLPYNSFGSYHLRAGRAATAADLFRQGLERAPSNLTLLYNLGLAAFQADDVDASADAWERVVRSDPEHVGALGGLLSSRFALGDFPGAVQAGERAVALQPDDYTLRLSLAEARRWAPGQRTQAEADYRASIALARDHLAVARTPEVLLRIASAYAGLEQADSTRAYLAQVEDALTPGDAPVHDAYNLGVTYEIIGDRDRALVWLRSALSRGFGKAKADRSPWLRALRSSADYSSLTTPDS